MAEAAAAVAVVALVVVAAADVVVIIAVAVEEVVAATTDSTSAEVVAAVEVEAELVTAATVVEFAVEVESLDTRVPTPQGMASPFGCVLLAGVVVLPSVAAMVNLVVQVTSLELPVAGVNWRKYILEVGVTSGTTKVYEAIDVASICVAIVVTGIMS